MNESSVHHSTLDATMLADRFKELKECEHIPLKLLFNEKYQFMDSSPQLQLPPDGCVYAFWWVNGEGALPPFAYPILSYSGPNKIKVQIKPLAVTDSDKKRTCLYVGKTHKHFRKRLVQHLRWKVLNEYQHDSESGDLKRKSIKCTTNQLRRGMERLYWEKDRNMRDFIRENVAVSFVPMPGHGQAVNRFFLELKAIADFLPLLNVDIER